MDLGEVTSKISICVPIYNEEDIITELIDRILSTIYASKIYNYEIIIVDNCSTDKTLEILNSYLQIHDKNITVAKHSRNYGYQTSIETCFKLSSGDFVAIIDGDLQDPPELIPVMIKKMMANNLNVVYGVRRTRKDSRLNKYLYKSFYRIWRKLADIEIQEDAGEFAVYDRNAVSIILKFKEKNRFQRGIRAYIGLKQEPFPYDRDARQIGVSKFHLTDQFKLALDGIFSFSLAPIRLIILIGFSIFSVSFLLAVTSLGLKLLNMINSDLYFGQMAAGLVQIFFVFTMLFGVVILILGIIGEYLGRIYDEVRNRPVIIQTLNGNDNLH